MGGAVIETGSATACEGDDVVKELNDVFDHPHSQAFKCAKLHNDFGRVQNIADNYQALIDAYTTVGVAVSETWKGYLTELGQLVPQGPDNIHTIAKARFEGLSDDKAMKTKKHKPKHGGHVHRTDDASAADPITIDSPYPLPKPKT